MKMSQNIVSKNESRPLTWMGAWSAIGIAILLVTLTLVGGVSYGDLLINIGKFVTGDLSGVSHGNESMISSILNIVAIVLMTLVAAIVTGSIFSRGAKSYESEKLDALLKRGAFVVFLVILIEELFTRGLFLALGTMFFKGDLGFYVLFFLGNSIWALVHLSNFSDKSERSPLRVIPQFVGGIAFTYIFARYGLGAAIMAHFLYDVILFATRKEKLPNKATWFTMRYYGVLAIILYFVCSASGISLTDVAPWINNELVPLDSYNFFQYAALLVLIDCIIAVIADALLLDSREVKPEVMKYMSSIFGLVFTGLVTVGVIFGGNWLLSLFVQDLTTRALTLTIIISLLGPTTSGSMLARATLVGLPSTYFTIVAFSVLGLWPAFGLSMIFLLVAYIPMYVQSKSFRV